jgi:lipopolysaccharide export system protein LptA
LRNRQAARYARWSAMAAGLVALAVAALYVDRAFREAHARQKEPKALSLTVEQQSAQFSFSKVEQDRTIFTIRASRATQYKDRNRAVLEDVGITIYGRDQSRHDSIHTQQCSYESDTGAVECQGEVEIEIQNAPPNGQATPTANELEVKTSNLSFNRNTGEASTPAAVEFRFPTGQGRGRGGSYSSQEGIVRVEHDVVFDMAPSQETNGLPVTATGSSLEIRRKDRTVVLAGPAVVNEGSRKISADKITIELDTDYHARHLIAEGHPQVQSSEARREILITADRLEGFLSGEGSIESVVADGNVAGTRQTVDGTDRFSAARVEFAMIPARNLIKEMTATGGVTAELHQASDTHVLRTDAMRLEFSTGPVEATGKPPAGSIEHQQVESVETLAPATIESKGAKDTMALRAKQFVAEIGADGHLDKLLGHSGVEVRRVVGGGAPQTVLATEMIAKFDAHGQWENVQESGNVRFQQADRQASASDATISRPADTITLEGSPVISDSMSRTTAKKITIQQSSGELHAAGDVLSTYIPSSEHDTVGLGSGNAHVSADRLSGSVSSGHVSYDGHARLWQGDSVLESEEIEIWRDEKKLKAVGHVVAVFPQSSGPLASLPGAAAPPNASSSKPTLWTITAPSLTYFNDEGRAHLEGGVTARSDQGSLESNTLDAFLEALPETKGGGSAPTGSEARQLSRVLAQGSVVVREGDRRGTAEQAEYTAADGKFVLSGGRPTLANAASDTATGHSLTFFVANDTILVDSEEGLRTVTKHRVEK